MKQITLSIFIFLFPLFSMAQIKGDWLVGGSAGFDASKRESGNSTTNNFNVYFSPQFSTFFLDNWEAGINIPFGYSDSKNDVFNLETGHIVIGANVFGRKYFPINERFFIFWGLELGYLWNERTFSNTNKTSHIDLTAEMNAGITYKFCPRFLAYGKLSALRFSGNQDGYSGGFFLDGTGSVLNFGLLIIFRRSPAMRDSQGSD